MVADLWSACQMPAVEAAGALLGPAVRGNGSVGPPGTFYLARPATIHGGSGEIPRGILARQVLDLSDA